MSVLYVLSFALIVFVISYLIDLAISVERSAEWIEIMKAVIAGIVFMIITNWLRRRRSENEKQ